MATDKKRIKQLIDLLDQYDESYYNSGTSLVSDPEYDALKDELKGKVKAWKPSGEAEGKLHDRALEATIRVGAPPPKGGFTKVVHEVAMGSLEKENTPEQMEDWFINKCNSPGGGLFVSEKLDGCSVDLKYENGEFVRGATRGDGEVGTDITRNVLKMGGLVKKVKGKFTGHVRGEMVLPKSKKDKYFPEMKAVRNAANGIAGRLHGTGHEHLEIKCYTVECDKQFSTEQEAMEYIESLGFKTPNWKVVKNLSAVVALRQQYMDKKRATLDYDIDGLVVRINDIDTQVALGEYSSGRPQGARAFKFESPKAKTEVTEMVIQVGDTGQITPVCVVKTVDLMGNQVSRASVHNFGIVKEMGLDVGAEVLIEKANDVIPQICEVVKGTGTYLKAPKKCPECGSTPSWRGKILVCTNWDCPARVKGRLHKWIKELGILEWGDSILTKLINAGLVTDVDDMYKLTVDDIAGLDREGKRSAEVKLAELDKFRDIPLENLIGGLCIENVATSTVKQVMKAGHQTLDEMFALSVSDLEAVPKFGEIRARAFCDGLKEQKARIKAILNAGVTIKAKGSGKLNGMVICFSGSFEGYKKPELMRMVTDNGGEAKKNFSSDLTYLVTESKTTSKAKAAAAKGINILSQQEFLDLLK